MTTPVRFGAMWEVVYRRDKISRAEIQRRLGEMPARLNRVAHIPLAGPQDVFLLAVPDEDDAVVCETFGLQQEDSDLFDPVFTSQLNNKFDFETWVRRYRTSWDRLD